MAVSKRANKESGWRFESINAVVDRHAKYWPSSAFRVWIFLWRCESGKTATVTTCHTSIAAATGIKPRTITRCITALTDAGYVRRISGGVPGIASTYEIRFPAFKSVDFERMWKTATDNDPPKKLLALLGGTDVVQPGVPSYYRQGTVVVQPGVPS